VEKGDVDMFTPEFSIGAEVKSEKYNIRHAIIVGVETYIEKNFSFRDLEKLDDAVSKINNCDYEIIFEYGSKVITDTVSEQYLELEN
jgi:hypothetical protein